MDIMMNSMFCALLCFFLLLIAGHCDGCSGSHNIGVNKLDSEETKCRSLLESRFQQPGRKCFRGTQVFTLNINLILIGIRVSGGYQSKEISDPLGSVLSCWAQGCVLCNDKLHFLLLSSSTSSSSRELNHGTAQYSSASPASCAPLSNDPEKFLTKESL